MKILLALLFGLSSMTAMGQTKIELKDITSHVGDSVEVSGKVFGIAYFEKAQNSPTLINVGGKYPNQLLTVVLYGEVREKLNYNPQEEKYAQGGVLVKGLVELYKGKPQIVIHDPKQLVFLIDEEVPANQLPKIGQ